MSQRIKVIEIYEEVTSCNVCMFCSYNSDYGRSYDSGYDCTHENGGDRIADDYEIKVYSETLRVYEASLLTLFPLDKPDIKNPMDFPNWCPLKDKEGV